MRRSKKEGRLPLLLYPLQFSHHAVINLSVHRLKRFHELVHNSPSGVFRLAANWLPKQAPEVSQCNDGNTDNRFNPPMGRFPAIEEDEPPYRLLCNEYPPAP